MKETILTTIITIIAACALIAVVTLLLWRWQHYCVNTYAPSILQTDDKVAIATFCRR